jgi:hypothetical protein
LEADSLVLSVPLHGAQNLRQCLEMFFSPEVVVSPQDDAEEHRYISALPQFLFIIFERTSWNGHELQKDYRPIQPSKKIDMMPFALNCDPNLEYRLAAMISETNVPEENNYVTFINLYRHWTRFDGDGIRKVPNIEEMADRWNVPEKQYQASCILLYVPCE